MNPKVPPDILHLLEKRALPDRRKTSAGKADGAANSSSQDRRRKARRQPPKGKKK